jgi:hypothetical protein
MTFKLQGSRFASAGLFLLVVSAAQAQEADNNYAWIDPPIGKHERSSRRREVILLRAARLAEERGYTHFELMRAPAEPAEGGVDADARKVTDAYGNASNSILPSPLASSPTHSRGGVLVRFCSESVWSCPGVRAHRILLNLRP